MHPKSMRLIDRWVGIPLCFITSLWLWIRNHHNQCKKSPDLIIFIGIAEIGALVVAYPAIDYARRNFPGSRICFITSPAGKHALNLMKFIDNDILIVCTETLPTLFIDIINIYFKLRKFNVSAVILEPFTRFSILLANWIGAKQCIGFYPFLNEGSYIGNLLTHRLVYNPHIHASQSYLSLVSALTCQSTKEPLIKIVIPDQNENRLKIEIDESECNRLREKLQKEIPNNILKQIILINPNASDIVPLRKWPIKNFIELSKRLLADSKITIILTGSSEEYAGCEYVLKEINPDRIINFAGKTTFKELITLYSISDLLVTNDSGPVHFASTTNIPIIALFGPETPKIFGPMSPHAKIISLQFACSPCVSVYNQKNSSCTDNQCMKQISVPMVFNETQKLLGI